MEMENKSTICQACLSRERELFPLKKLQDLVLNTDLVDLNFNHDGGLCWECKRIVMKFSRFKQQVQLAQFYLQEIGKHQDVKCFSNLSSTGTDTYNYPILYDPLIEDFTNSLPKEIKQEINEEYNSNCNYEEKPDYDSDIDIQAKETIKESTVKTKENKVAKAKKESVKRKTIINQNENDDVKNKFFEVEFTEEEMVKSREEKRSHPNFKKLPYNCETCVLGFTKEENYNLHVVKKHDTNIGPHSCPVCQVRFSTPTSLARHVKKHYHSYRCKLCPYETSELWSALSHCRSKHSEDSEDCIHCQQCSYVAKKQEELSEHMKTQHCLTCQECGEKFKGPSTLKTHIRRIHGTPREHLCSLCPRSFRTPGRLLAHVTSHGAGAAARAAYCAQCRVQYKNIYVYRNHLATSASHSERRYNCEECGKKFASKVYYKRHYTFYHQKKSPFKCELCNRLFISDWRLRNHRQTRHGMARARNHACEECGKKFFTSSTLKAHQLTHSTQRTFMCAACGDTFKQRPALYTHTRLVHRRNTRDS